MMKIVLDGDSLTMDLVWQVAQNKNDVQVELKSSSVEKMTESRSYLENRLASGDVMYGVNTGFGAFSSVKISEADIHKLQINIVRSHSVGVGDPFTKEESRAIMLLRANALSRGHSGIRVEVVEKILEYLNKDIIPVIPQQGSVGASGDLAPLAHLALTLIGEGEVWAEEGPVDAAEALKLKKTKPISLKAKEGLSLINGCQVMTAVGMLNAFRARRLMWLVDLGGAMTLEALKGARSAFDPIIFATRPHPGEAETARNMLKLLGERSEIGESHSDCERVQDAYSLRCMPAVHGAAKQNLRQAVKTLEIEANSSTDNPLVFAKEEKILSCGNFHGEPVAVAMDSLAIALSAMGSISECRIEKLINPSMSGLPAFLAPNGGLNSGMMIAQVTAASLVSENKILSHPACVDSIPTSADKEDHVSMGTIASRKLGQIVGNIENIVAIELLCAAQALGFLKPLNPTAAVLSIYQAIEKDVPFAEVDRNLSLDIKKIRDGIDSNAFVEIITQSIGELEW